MIQIREAQESDLVQIVILEKENPSPWSQGLLADELHDVRGIFLVAEEKKNIVAWLVARVLPPEAELLKIAVLQQKRRKGVAKELFRALCAELVSQNCRELFLEVRAQNFSAGEFYRANGFVQIGKRALYYQKPDDDALVLRKDLPEKTDNFKMGSTYENDS